MDVRKKRNCKAVSQKNIRLNNLLKFKMLKFRNRSSTPTNEQILMKLCEDM